MTRLIAITLLLSGCAATPKFDPAKLDYGPEPKDPLEIVSHFEKRIAADPDAIKVRLDRKVTPFFTYNKFTGENPVPGWAVCYSVNGKNVYGGYVGFQRRFALIKDDAIIQYEVDRKAGEMCFPG